jgi:hypothetical protein
MDIIIRASVIQIYDLSFTHDSAISANVACMDMISTIVERSFPLVLADPLCRTNDNIVISNCLGQLTSGQLRTYGQLPIDDVIWIAIIVLAHKCAIDGIMLCEAVVVLKALVVLAFFVLATTNGDNWK